jgi:hypothetical protein
LDKFLAVRDDAPEFYSLSVPGADRADGGRIVRQLEVQPPHELLAEEVRGNPKVLEELAAARPHEEWARNYSEHPVVVANPAGTVLPLAVYLDGVPFTRTDGFLGIWVYNLISWRRHLVAVVRKSEMCSCSCRKWCTLWPIFHWLAWSLRALAEGLAPATRHDGSPFFPNEHHRIAMAGKGIVKGAVVLVKADWAEMTGSLGFPNWQTNRSPCLFCHCDKEGLYTLRGLSPVSFPAALKTEAECAAACAAAEVRVVLTSAEQHR